MVDFRDVKGIIFGGDQMTDWTVMHRAKRTTFINPQPGLYDRIAAVRALAQELPVEGRVVFTARGQFPKGLPRYTLSLESLAGEFPSADRISMTGSVPDMAGFLGQDQTGGDAEPAGGAKAAVRKTDARVRWCARRKPPGFHPGHGPQRLRCAADASVRCVG